MKQKKDSKEEQQTMGEETPANEQAQMEQADTEDNVEESQQIETLEIDDLDRLLEQVQDLKLSQEELEQKAEEYLDGWQRARAEFANYKKRILREQAEVHQTSRGEVIKLYLDISDDLKRALEERPTNPETESWANGIELIYQKLRARLDAEGVKSIEALGQEFDPNLHEALMKMDSDEYESGMVIEVVKEGYMIGDKVLRPALVRVAA